MVDHMVSIFHKNKSSTIFSEVFSTRFLFFMLPGVVSFMFLIEIIICLCFKIGAGGIMNAIKFWPEDYNLVLSAAVDGTVRLNDVEGRNSRILADTMNAHE